MPGTIPAHRPPPHAALDAGAKQRLLVINAATWSTKGPGSAWDRCCAAGETPWWCDCPGGHRRESNCRRQPCGLAGSSIARRPVAACCRGRCGPDAGVPKRGQSGPDQPAGAPEGGGQRPAGPGDPATTALVRRRPGHRSACDARRAGRPRLDDQRSPLAVAPLRRHRQGGLARRGPFAGASCAHRQPDGARKAGLKPLGWWESRYGAPIGRSIRRWPLGGDGGSAQAARHGTPAAITATHGPAPAHDFAASCSAPIAWTLAATAPSHSSHDRPLAALKPWQWRGRAGQPCVPQAVADAARPLGWWAQRRQQSRAASRNFIRSRPGAGQRIEDGSGPCATGDAVAAVDCPHRKPLP